MLLVGVDEVRGLAGPAHRHIAYQLFVVEALLNVGLVKLEDDLLLELDVLALEIFKLGLGLDRKVLLRVLLVAHHGCLLLMVRHHVLILVLHEGHQLLVLVLLFQHLLLLLLVLLLGGLGGCHLGRHPGLFVSELC